MHQPHFSKRKKPYIFYCKLFHYFSFAISIHGGQNNNNIKKKPKFGTLCITRVTSLNFVGTSLITTAGILIIRKQIINV